MGLIESIENTRRTKSERQRKRLALAISGMITGLIFVVWLSVLLPRDAQRMAVEDAGQVVPSESESWSEIAKNVSEGYDVIREDMSEFKDELAAAVAFSASSTATTTGTATGDMTYVPPGNVPVEGVGSAVYEPTTKAATGTEAAMPPAEARNGL